MNADFDTYYELLRRLHSELKPRRYLEIGVHKGHSLTFVEPGTEVVGVDPAPMIEVDVPGDAMIVPLTSDAFFATTGADQRFDLAFVDGLHHFDVALRDFINIEQRSHAHTVILIHDCLPIDAETSTREHNTMVWSGDVWKTMAAIRSRRPDLTAFTVDAAPTGLGIICGLDPTSTVLADAYDDIVAEYMPRTFADLDRSELNVIPPIWSEIAELLPHSGRPVPQQ